MAVPPSCTVLVIGGGPAGSYAAAALAREGIETVVLEADKFPRLVTTVLSRKPDLALNTSFRLTPLDTDFLEAGGPDGYAWNLIRSEFDDLLFKHAGTCGAQIFAETKVDAIQFGPVVDGMKPDRNNDDLNFGQPVSATWVRQDGTSGSITYKYLVDASGRQGILSTKYLKNRKFNNNFKNAAIWAYWKSDNVYGPGTHMEGSPYFEALDGEFFDDWISLHASNEQTDASGWAWFMPLHDGTRSVGIVLDQKMATEKKQELGCPSTLDFYKQCLEMAPRIRELLSEAELIPHVRSASDWSYTASTYHLPNARVCGDAGSFIDPLFSSGVHLAITGGLSAAATISASIRGDCSEAAAGSWHSKKTVESYTRFFLAVSSATKQIRTQHEPIIQDMDEEGFQRAFDLFRPSMKCPSLPYPPDSVLALTEFFFSVLVIQGTVDADTAGKVSKFEISKILQFCFKAFAYVPPEKKDALFDKLRNLDSKALHNDAKEFQTLDGIEKHLTADELQILETLRSRRMIREDPFEMDSFTLDTIDGMAPNLVRGSLGLVDSEQAKIDTDHFYSQNFLDGNYPGIREGSVHLPTSRIQLG
ncbi:putative flavin-dependent halogenase/O-methyltransferase [Metarhizium acridum CQMa 102]|uniref:Putative flavin-dependent halogenase/O-methyltransferase n=1 Tax=Metarhizium acridum (strain CQMa 102) TaxID=655827 RepID=E9E2D5_METAQ|nr:putative flavin-dependent halogenase/O-methyltransferase [Metarhizium acridum CQMa 102]EFY89824.1 putative flavin-dependent halogenase/O-methyltransferase [Metarhizium acridum CQMa 102]